MTEHLIPNNIGVHNNQHDVLSAKIISPDHKIKPRQVLTDNMQSWNLGN